MKQAYRVVVDKQVEGKFCTLRDKVPVDICKSSSGQAEVQPVLSDSIYWGDMVCMGE
jgi:hypothetical protein